MVQAKCNGGCTDTGTADLIELIPGDGGLTDLMQDSLCFFRAALAAIYQFPSASDSHIATGL